MTSLPDLALPLLQALAPETAHRASILALRLLPRARARARPAQLAREALGLSFPNPVGLAAGFDKHAEVPDAMLGMGFGFVEIGTVTPRPQSGNPEAARVPPERRPRGHQPPGLQQRGSRRRGGAARSATRPGRHRRRQYRPEPRQPRCRGGLRGGCNALGALGRLPRRQRLLAQHAGPARAATEGFAGGR